ncbi:MAG: hypothetical protein QXK59_04620 [Archaeoglobaceae archaeon]
MSSFFVSSAATPIPTIAGTFSVPARLPSSWIPPCIALSLSLLLQKAALGIYSEAQLKNLEEEMRRKYFEKVRDNFRVKEFV